jgi:hypothetical protein
LQTNPTYSAGEKGGRQSERSQMTVSSPSAGQPGAARGSEAVTGLVSALGASGPGPSLPPISTEKLSGVASALFDALSLIHATADAVQACDQVGLDPGGISGPESRAISLSAMAAAKVVDALQALESHV